ncbi:hypothetical protein ACH0BU_17915 [Sphingomonas olei]
MKFDWNDHPLATVAVRINLGMSPLHVVQEWIDASPTGWRDHDWCHFIDRADALAFAAAFPAWLLELEDQPVRREPRRTVERPRTMQALTAMIRDSQRRQFLKPLKRQRRA